MTPYDFAPRTPMRVEPLAYEDPAIVRRIKAMANIAALFAVLLLLVCVPVWMTWL